MFRGFMNKLRLGVTIVIAIIMIGCLMGGLGINDSSNSLTVVERIVMYCNGTSYVCGYLLLVW